MRHGGNSGCGCRRGEVATGGRGHLERAHEGQDIGLRGKYTGCGGWAKRKMFWLKSTELEHVPQSPRLRSMLPLVLRSCPHFTLHQPYSRFFNVLFQRTVMCPVW